MRRIALALLVALSGCTHAWDWDGGASWDAQQRALAQQQYDQEIYARQAQVTAHDRMVCEHYAGPTGSQAFADCVWQIETRRAGMMAQGLQAIPQPQPPPPVYYYWPMWRP